MPSRSAYHGIVIDILQRIVAVLMLRCVLEFTYRHLIGPTYSYQGFGYNAAALDLIVAGYLMLVVSAIMLPARVEWPSDVVAVVLVVVVIVPTSFVPFVSGRADVDSSAWFLVVSVVSVGLLALGPRLLMYGEQGLGLQRMPLWIVAAGSLVLVAAVVAAIGFPRRLPALAEIYSVRERYVLSLNGARRFVPYAVLWLANVFLPFLAVASILRKKMQGVALALCCAIVLFGITGMKAVLGATVVAALAAFLLSRRAWRRTAVLVVACSTAVGVLALADRFLVGGTLLTGVFTRRVFAMPGLLSGYYADLFVGGNNYLLSHSFLRAVQAPVFRDAPPALVGSTYFGTTELSANAHFLADALANFGLLGVVFYSLMLALILVLLNATSATASIGFRLSVTVPIAFMLANAALPTVFVTHGLAVLIIMLSVVRLNRA